LCSHFVGEFHKFWDGKLLRTTRHHLVFEERWRNGMVSIEDLTEGDAEHLTALVEDGLHHTTEETFVTAKVSHLITRHADDGTLYLGRGIEYAGLDCKEVLHIVPGLNQDRQNAVLFIAGL